MKIILALFLSGLSISLFSQRTLSDKQWIEDLNFMIHRIDSVHPNPYCHISKGQFQSEISRLKSKIPKYSDNEIIVELLRIVTLLKDGHTRLHGNNLTKKWYPIRIEEFSDGYFITSCANEYKSAIGLRVIKINNHPVEKVFELIKNTTPHDNEFSQIYLSPMLFTMTSVFSGLHIDDSSGILTIVTKSSDNEEKALQIDPVEFKSGDDLAWFWRELGVPCEFYSNIISNNDSLPLYLQNYDKPFWFEYLKSNDAVYFDFNECAGDKSFENFNKDLWEFVDSVKAKYLIMDLRNNFGGTNSILQPLIHEIIRHDEINQAGHLFIIIGHKTFSAALHCATWIEYHCNPVFIGESTGAGPNHFGDPDFSILPNSGILLMVSKYYWQNTWPWDKRAYINPSVNVSLSSFDYFHNRDPVLEKVLTIIESK